MKVYTQLYASHFWNNRHNEGKTYIKYISSSSIEKTINLRWDFCRCEFDIFFRMFWKWQSSIFFIKTVIPNRENKFEISYKFPKNADLAILAEFSPKFISKIFVYLGQMNSLLSLFKLSLNSTSGMEYILWTVEISLNSLLKPSNFSFMVLAWRSLNLPGAIKTALGISVSCF